MRHYEWIDYATQAYLAVVGMLLLCFHNDTVPHWGWLVTAHLLGMTLLHRLVRRSGSMPPNSGWTLLRGFYPIILYTPLYMESEHLNRMFCPTYLDPVFLRMEAALFGFQPSLAWMDAWPWLVWSEVMYAAYFSYYVMILGMGLWLYRRGGDSFRHFVSVISVVFYTCYLVFLFLPVIGPPVFFNAPAGMALPPEIVPSPPPCYPESVQSGPFFKVMGLIYRHLEGAGAAFPSSHVAVAMATLYFSFRYVRSIRWIHAFVVGLLCMATVYCRYHYVVDVVAGLAAAAILVPVANWLYWRFRS